MGSFSFTDKVTDKLVDFGIVEDAIREHRGLEPSTSEDCPYVDNLADLGIALLFNQGGSTVTEKHIKDMRGWSHLDKANQDMVEWVFLTKWDFTAWR
jgi:hypothetical protein